MTVKFNALYVSYRFSLFEDKYKGCVSPLNTAHEYTRGQNMSPCRTTPSPHGRTCKFVKKGGIFWEGGIDPGSQRHFT